LLSGPNRIAMPPLARWFVRTALVYFVAALLVGVALMLRLIIDLPPVFGALQPVYFHLLMVGWVAQLIFGVVYWMFPKYSADRPRGSERLGWATFWLLNIGLVLRAIGEPLTAVRPGLGAGGLLAASAVLQLLAGWAFVLNTWPRVKER
jgi:Cytochrome C and Quinol oxidase polypeptide I